MISPSLGLVSIFIYSFGLSFITSSYLSIFIAPLMLVVIQKKAVIPVLKKLIFLNIFIIIMSLSATIHQDYEYALLIFLRANALIFFTLLIFYDKTLFDIATSLQTLKFPDKLVSLFFFVSKFIIIIKEEFLTTKKAMVIRNFKSKSNIFSYQVYANIVGIMVVKCFDRADKLKSSIILRNFQGKIYQSKIDKISKIDLLILFGVLISISLRIGEITL